MGERSERLLGTLVHRFIQRAGLTHEVDALTVQVSLRHLVRPDEQPSDGSLDDLLAQAATLYRNLSMRADVRALYETGDIYHEVPFTFVQDGSRSRGSIDCVIARHEPPGNVHALTILEFKTGQERPEHREQVAAYKLAMDAMFPGVPVSAVIVYPDALLVM